MYLEFEKACIETGNDELLNTIYNEKLLENLIRSYGYIKITKNNTYTIDRFIKNVYDSSFDVKLKLTTILMSSISNIKSDIYLLQFGTFHIINKIRFSYIHIYNNIIINNELYRNVNMINNASYTNIFFICNWLYIMYPTASHIEQILYSILSDEWFYIKKYIDQLYNYEIDINDEQLEIVIQ